jgi:hypothetical protein
MYSRFRFSSASIYYFFNEGLLVETLCPFSLSLFLQDVDIFALIELLVRNRYMTLLDVSGNEISEWGASALLEALLPHRALRYLDLGGNAFLAEYFRLNFLFFLVLFTAGNSLYESSGPMLCALIEHAKVLETLVLAQFELPVCDASPISTDRFLTCQRLIIFANLGARASRKRTST